jgi:O-antigen chain-terminating methyltransferase
MARRLGLSRWLAGEGLMGRLQQQAFIAQLDGLETSRRRLEQRAAEQDTQVRTLSDSNASLTRQLTVIEDSLSKTLSALANSVAGHESRMAKLEQVVDVDALSARIDEVAGCLRSDLDSRVIAAEAIAEQSRRDIADQQRRIGLMLNALNAVKALGHGVPASVEAADDHAMDALYVAFEDRFRGTRATIKQRQRIYLPHLHGAGAGTKDRPVLDIGAGRGEFLELLCEEGLQCVGVDSNQTMVSVCHDAGLDCVQGDALAWLAARADRSLGAITGFHIIEHLPFKVMVRIIDEALRVLVPGGLLILETPNPANLLTASRWFYLDPTHRNPLPGEMVAMIAEARGFPYPEILELHPMAARFPGSDRQLTGALDRIFYGPQDYALIARKP